jgi:DNA-directed RNA polymerase subunit RPC12/RpoP
MGKVCVRCGREVKASFYQDEGPGKEVVWSCPHCGPNVEVRDTEKTEMKTEGEMADEFQRISGEAIEAGYRGIIACMGERIDDLKERADFQEKLIQHLLGRPEQVPTRDDLIEALATARARLEAQDREKLELRNLAATLQEQVEFLSEEARSLHGVIRKLIEKLPDEVLRSVPDQPQALEPMVATQPPSAPDEDQP